MTTKVMPGTEEYKRPKDLVYRANSDIGSVVFADRETALYAAQIYDALTSETWAKFRATLPEGGWGEYLQRWGAQDDEGNPVDDFPTGDERFDGDRGETGYPEWLASTMLSWFPDDLIEKYGGSALAPGFDGEWSLYLPFEAAEEIATDLRARGCTVEPSPVDLI
jgi:hypothetical protein